MIATYPAVNPVSVYNDKFILGSFNVSHAVTEYTGGTPQQYPGRYKAISSSTYITGNAPQTLIIEPDTTRLSHQAECTHSSVRRARLAWTSPWRRSPSQTTPLISTQLARSATRPASPSPRTTWHIAS